MLTSSGLTTKRVEGPCEYHSGLAPPRPELEQSFGPNSEIVVLLRYCQYIWTLLDSMRHLMVRDPSFGLPQPKKTRKPSVQDREGQGTWKDSPLGPVDLKP